MKLCLIWFMTFLGLVQAQNEWFLGKWTAKVDINVYTLENRSDGTYTFTANDSINPLYEELGTWTLNGTEFIQNWNDPATGEPTTATYLLEKLSDTAFNQSGGNLGEGFVFNFTKVTGTLTPSQGQGKPGTKPGTAAETTTTTETTTTPENPLSTQTATNPSGEVAASPVDPTVTAEFLVGEWLTLDGDLFVHFNRKPDGTYTSDISHLNGEVIFKEEGQWSLENNGYTETWQDQNTGETLTTAYVVERTSENAYRITGGNFGLKSYLYNRLETLGAVTPRTGWLVGSWWTTYGVDTHSFIFNPDGTYSFTLDPFNEDSKQSQGTWTLNNDQLALAGDLSVTYTLTKSGQYLYIAGGDYETDSAGQGEMFMASDDDVGPFNPFVSLALAGQYLQGNNTLTITAEGSNYGGTWLQDGVLYTLKDIQVSGDRVSLKTVGPDSKEYDWAFRFVNNGLLSSADFLGDSFFQKISETTLPTVNEILNFWTELEDFSNDDTLILLPDGSYVETNTYDQTFTTRGLYTLQDNQLTLDPDCSAPSTYTVTQAESQLLLSYTSGEDTYTTTYSAPNQTTYDYRFAQAALNQKQLAADNEAWLQKITTGPVVPGPSPLGGEIAADPNPDNHFEGATVFTEQEVYPYQSDYYMAYTTDGAFVQTSVSQQIIETMSSGGIYQDIDATKGSYYDKINRYFFANGRVYVYFESYTMAESIAYPPKPSVIRVWGKYKIENGQILIESDAGEPLSFELIYGNRKIRTDEECYDNLEFAAQ
jgi:hypothetical protein